MPSMTSADLVDPTDFLESEVLFASLDADGLRGLADILEGIPSDVRSGTIGVSDTFGDDGEVVFRQTDDSATPRVCLFGDNNLCPSF